MCSDASIETTLPSLPACDSCAEIAVERRIAQHQPDHQPLVAELRHQARKLEALLDRRDDGFFTENLQAGLKAQPDVVEMHVVRRTDHQQVELFVGDQLLGRGIGLAGGDAVFLHSGKTCGGRVDVTNDLEILVYRLENIGQISEAESEPDYPDFHAELFPLRNLFSQVGI